MPNDDTLAMPTGLARLTSFESDGGTGRGRMWRVTHHRAECLRTLLAASGGAAAAAVISAFAHSVCQRRRVAEAEPSVSQLRSLTRALTPGLLCVVVVVWRGGQAHPAAVNNGGIKGKRPSKKDKLRALAARQ